MYSKRQLPDIEQWSQSSGSNVIPRRARPGLAGLRPHILHRVQQSPLTWVVRVGGDDGELRLWHYIYVYSIESRLIMRVRYDSSGE